MTLEDAKEIEKLLQNYRLLVSIKESLLNNTPVIVGFETLPSGFTNEIIGLVQDRINRLEKNLGRVEILKIL